MNITTGPWTAMPNNSRIEADATEWDIDAWDDDAKESCTIAFVAAHDLADVTQVASNAKLIAAAPELLACLVEMLGAAETDCMDDKSNVWRSLMIDAHAAIAKARGE